MADELTLGTSQDIGRHSGEMRARAWANHLDGSCNPCVFWASARGCAKEKCDSLALETKQP